MYLGVPFLGSNKLINYQKKKNHVTNNLARYAIGILDFLVWMEDVPPQLHSVLQTDLIGLHQ